MSFFSRPNDSAQMWGVHLGRLQIAIRWERRADRKVHRVLRSLQRLEDRDPELYRKLTDA